MHRNLVLSKLPGSMYNLAIWHGRSVAARRREDAARRATARDSRSAGRRPHERVPGLYAQAPRARRCRASRRAPRPRGVGAPRAPRRRAIDGEILKKVVDRGGSEDRVPYHEMWSNAAAVSWIKKLDKKPIQARPPDAAVRASFAHSSAHISLLLASSDHDGALLRPPRPRCALRRAFRDGPARRLYRGEPRARRVSPASHNSNAAAAPRAACRRRAAAAASNGASSRPRLDPAPPRCSALAGLCADATSCDTNCPPQTTDECTGSVCGCSFIPSPPPT